MNDSTPDLDEYIATSEFEAFFERQLETFEKVLIKEGKAISGRPMLSAMLFVTHCIHDKNGEPPADFLDHEWFGKLVKLSTRWYRDKYGPEVLASATDAIIAVVPFAGMPVRLDIPRMPTEPTDKAWVTAVYFPRDVLKFEDPLSWLKPRPSLDGLGDDQRNAFVGQVRETCRAIRTAVRFIDGAVCSSEELDRLRSGVIGHLEKAATDICGDSRGTAVWELNLAVEKVTKAVLRQRGVSPIPRTHDITRLIGLAESQGMTACDRAMVQTLPSDGVAIQHRYGEIDPPTRDELFAMYDSALRTVAHVAMALEQGPFPDDRMFLRSLAWHPTHREEG